MKNKKQKISLDDLKVQSFVTAFDKSTDETQEVKGGGSIWMPCYTHPYCYTGTCAGDPVETSDCPISVGCDPRHSDALDCPQQE